MALRWFCNRSLLRGEGLAKELIDRIPGKQTDRRTPLGELNWIFTAITDTIAWNMLPRALFQKLFRQVGTLSDSYADRHHLSCCAAALMLYSNFSALCNAGPAGGEPVPQLSAGGAHHACQQLHARVLAQAAADAPAPHVARLGHGRGDVPPSITSVSSRCRYLCI